MMGRFVYATALVCFLMLAVPNQSNAEKLTLDKLSSFTKASAASLKNGQYRVIVEFHNDIGKGTTSANSNKLESLNQANEKSDRDTYLLRTLKRQSKTAGNMGGRYIRSDLRTLSVNQSELVDLITDGSLTVYEDKFHKPSLASSVNVVFPTQAASAFDSMTGIDAGVACDSSITECAHGTQMAGVIAGQGATSKGIATSANIIPIQIYSSSSNELVCGDASLTPCIGALTSDIVSALDYVNSIKTSYTIAAVNVSAASTITYQGECDLFEPIPYTTAIADLAASGIAVIASSGNDALDNEMSSPACLSDVIAVAATNDSDVAWSLNNRNSELDFFAPGVSVSTSTLPNNDFTAVSGTSVSAALVSGAWAVMKSKTPTASVAAVKNILANTGELVTQGLFVKPRINLAAALDETIDVPVEVDEACVPVKSTNGNIALICL